MAETFPSSLRGVIDVTASIDYQKRVWLGDILNKNTSFVEVFEGIVLNDIDVIREHRDALACSGEEWELILRCIVRFLTYYAEINDVYDQATILGDPNWLTVVNAAKDVRSVRSHRST